MIRIFSVLTSGQGFDQRLEYKTILKLIPAFIFYGPIKRKRLITGLTQLNTSKKNFIERQTLWTVSLL